MQIDRERLQHIRSSMALLYANSERCAANHHGYAAYQQGLPGWLADCKRDLDDLTAMIDAAKGEG